MLFKRTAPNISPLDYKFTQFSGSHNITDIIKYDGAGIKSYWWATFITGSDKHQYSLVITAANAGPSQTVSSISLVDITADTHFGISSYEDGQMSLTSFHSKTSFLEVGSTASDQFSQNWAISTLPEAPFNLSFIPRGPNLYQGGSGEFIWGTDVAYCVDATETEVHGTITVGGKVVQVVPEKSMSWFDLQWGPGYASQGWHAFVILLDNGVKLQATVTHNTPLYKQGSFTTIGYPDGHQEVWAVDNSTYPTNPWVSPQSNITYYSNYILKIPGKGILYADLPVKGGETAPVVGSTPANTIADTFAWYRGELDGKLVKGWGIMELRENAGCDSFGC